MQSPNILVIPAYVLVIDDDSDRLKALRDRLQGVFREHDQVLALDSGEWLDTNRELMQRVPVQTVLVGRWSGWEQAGIRQSLVDSYPDIPFYFIDGDGEPGRDGAPAMDFAAMNPINSRIRRILRDIDAPGADNDGAPAGSPPDNDRPVWLFRGLSGTSAAIQSVRNDITLVAASDSTVLITGAAGTGKEIAARNIHFSRPGASSPSSPSTAVPDRRTSSSATSLATTTTAPTRAAGGASSWRTAAPCFSVISAPCRWPCSSSCCGFSGSGRSSVSKAACPA